MKNIFFLLLICSVSFSFGQSFNKSLYFSENGISIYFISTDCIKPEKGTAIQYLFIEVENTTSSAINISFNKEMWYDNVCQTCNANSNEYKIDIQVPANSKIEGNCDAQNKSLRIFSKMLNLDGVRQLTKYELKNIKIESIK